MAMTFPGALATPSATREARVLTIVAHAAGVFGIAPSAAMYVLLRDTDERTGEQARLALNWQLTLGTLLVALIVVDVVFSSLAFRAGAFGAVSLLAWLLLAPWAIGAVFAVWAGIRLWTGDSWNYPWSVPFIGSGVAAKRRDLLEILDRDDDEGTQTTPLATLALWFGMLGGVLGIVFGHVARARIRRTGEAGWGTATAGLALGYAEVIVGVIIVASILLSMLFVAPLRV
jgi:uncharacterized Tic20 family protein